MSHEQSRRDANISLNSIPQMMWTMDENAQFKYGNIIWQNYIGPCDSPLLDSSIVHPDDINKCREMWDRVQTQTNVDLLEIERRLLKHGTQMYHWFLTRAKKVIDPDNTLWIGTCTDIDDLKRLQAEAEVSSSWWKTLGDTVPVIIWTADDNGTINYYNKKYYDTVGPHEDDWTKLVHPDDLAEVQKVWQSAVDAKRMDYEKTFRMWNVNTKSYRWMEGQAVYVSSAPKDSRWIGTTVDIDDLTVALEVAREAQYMFNLLSENLPVIIYAVDTNGIVTTVVGSILKEFQNFYTIEEGDDFVKLIHKIDPDDEEKFWNVIRNGMTYAFRKELFDKVLQVNWIPVRDQDGVTVSGMLGISFDVTEEQRAVEESEELRVREQVAIESNRLKSQFLANMSHELRTPLTGIQGMSELLLETNLDTEQKSFITTITSNVNYLTSLVNDIIDISRIEAGKLDIQTLPFDVEIVVREVMANFQPTALDKGILLTYDVKVPVHTAVVTDPVRLRQILWNLVSNAVKFTLTGSVNVHVVCNEHELYLTVTDTGIGMSKMVQENLFKPFTQGDPSNTRRFGGTGLGLYITRLIIDKLHGTIDVISKENKGTKMTVSVPIELKSASTIEASHALQTILSVDALKGKHILVAEDNLVIQIIVKRTLERYGLIVTTTNNGKEAVDYFQDHIDDIDLVLMDIQMPVMDGFEALHHIQALSSQVPVVALTASAMKDDIARSYSEGMTDHLSKPFRAEELIRTVAKNLRARV